MAKQRTETSIENSVVSYAKKKGMLARKMNGMSYRHWPDRYFVYREGIDFYIEFKRPGKKPTEGQSEMIKDLRKRGKDVFIVDDVKEGKRIIDSIYKRCTV